MLNSAPPTTIITTRRFRATEPHFFEHQLYHGCYHIMPGLWKKLTGKSSNAGRQRLVPGQQAHEDFVLNLASPATALENAALARIRTKHAATSNKQLNPEFLSEAVADLDTVLFHGCLKDYMLINWVEMTGGTPSCMSRKPDPSPYETSASGNSQLRVRLPSYRSEPKEQTWGAVLHEMMHAYLDLKSEWHGLKQPHGPMFWESCRAIVTCLALDGLEVHHVELGADLTALQPTLDYEEGSCRRVYE